ncbi:hypothetical protein PACTADRAFT_35454 [Pachysolen tannophilus NRRL Y-2460]|uniref:Ubiquitin carboxyl-terminal hydrolase n=1 Tax=Pachysolen tannophilus NRRL Y-2460 TaxID=669874 RepID=A0A1E4TPL9_PACTA|nr:hypothetical protein PACTADRAFT_35454 [Pachysolen tannophilus NRRL Y-2460]
MSKVPVKIKNAGKTYEVDVDLSEPGLTFKLQISSLTGIQPERQKVLLKGGQLKDDSDMKDFNLKPNQVIMVLGTPDDKLPKKPIEKTVFVEDLEEENKLINFSDEPSGLVNLGNTCYLNSSLQSLFTVKEITQRLSNISKNNGTLINSNHQNFITFLGQLFDKMAKKETKITPLNFLTTLRTTFPQFSEMSDHGFYKQQDAEEAFSQILSTLLQNIKDLDNFFKIEFKTRTKCLETDEEPVIGFEDSLKLDCHISINTNFLKDGLMKNLKEKIEKRNELLDKNATYEVSRKIVKLPKYLTVHFVRFFWKRETNKKSKILRKVQFPMQLDLADMLDDDIKQQKCEFRDKIYNVEKENEEEAKELKKKKKNNFHIETMAQFDKEQSESKKLQEKWASNFKKAFPPDFDPNCGENPSSLYELRSIITHQGSSADSGHYQCFVKDETDLSGDKWWKFNDDKVSVVNREKIDQLAGGGEGDSALILMYKAVGLE